VCVGVVVQLCSFRVITPFTAVGVPCWLIPCNVLPVWLATICGREEKGETCMRETVRVWNNANTWVIIEWYLHVAGHVFLLIVGVCVVVCVVLVFCAAFNTGVEYVSNMFLCAGSWLHVCGFWPLFFEKKNYVLRCHGFVLHTGSPDRCILPLHCFIVILDPVLFACEGKCNCMVASFWPFPCQT